MGSESQGLTAEELADVAEAEYERLLALASRYASPSAGAEDIVQEAVLMAISNIGALEKRGSAGAWLAGFVIRLGAQTIRTHARRGGILSAFSVKDPAEGLPPTLADAQRTRQLWRAIESLPERARRILIQRVVRRSTVSETADALGIAEGTVKSSLHRSLRRLKQDLVATELFDDYARVPADCSSARGPIARAG